MDYKISIQGLTIMTIEQRDALVRMATDETLEITVYEAGFDLPDGYITFRQDFRAGHAIYGGISPYGDIST